MEWAKLGLPFRHEWQLLMAFFGLAGRASLANAINLSMDADYAVGPAGVDTGIRGRRTLIRELAENSKVEG